MMGENTPKTCAEAAAAAPFKTGDIVHLKSGGPSMTIFSGDCVSVECVWFTPDDLLQTEEFPLVCLAAGHGNNQPF